jgi:hypothetical protein
LSNNWIPAGGICWNNYGGAYYIDQNSLANSALASSWRHLLAGTITTAGQQEEFACRLNPLVPQTER